MSVMFIYITVLPDMEATCGDHAASGEAKFNDDLSRQPHGLHRAESAVQKQRQVRHHQ